jgi:signal transduction histidine kinase
MLGYALGAPPVVTFDDLTTETRFPAPAILSDHEVVSGVNVLIPVRYQPFGVLGVYTTEPRTFTTDEVQSLVAIAAVLATAIDRNRADSERAALLAREHAARVRLQESNQALARATQAKSEFLAAMSHELRTPLTSIMGFADLLLDDLGQSPEETERRQQVAHIYQSGQHLLSLVNDILDLAKVEAGRMELHPSEFDVAAALHSVEYRIRPLAEKKGITLSTDVAPGVTSVFADERKFHQVLYNLLSNAVKYTPDGGRVETTARAVNKTVEVVVTDNGVGITPLEQARVFEAFQQLSNASGQEQQGTGLGLALTRRLVELQGGHIWVESTPGQGSQFGFTIPVNVEGAEPGTAESDPTQETPFPPKTGEGGISLERAPVLAEVVEPEAIPPAESTAQLPPVADETTVTLSADEVAYEIASCVASSASSERPEVGR